MAQVVVNVNKRPYTMQCEDGEEAHVAKLAELLDREVGTIREAVGQVGDIRLLLMAGLVIADRLTEAQQRIEDLQDQITGLRENRSAGKEVEAQASKRLDAAAKRLETLAKEVGGNS